MQYLDPEAFKHAIATAEPRACIDVRTQEEYKEGHIEGVRNVPLQELAQRIGEFKDIPVLYLHCKSGARALAACQLLLLHYPAIQLITLDGGYDAWHTYTGQ